MGARRADTKKRCEPGAASEYICTSAALETLPLPFRFAATHPDPSSPPGHSYNHTWPAAAGILTESSGLFGRWCGNKETNHPLPTWTNESAHELIIRSQRLPRRRRVGAAVARRRKSPTAETTFRSRPTRARPSRCLCGGSRSCRLCRRPLLLLRPQRQPHAGCHRSASNRHRWQAIYHAAGRHHVTHAAQAAYLSERARAPIKWEWREPLKSEWDPHSVLAKDRRYSLDTARAWLDDQLRTKSTLQLGARPAARASILSQDSRERRRNKRFLREPRAAASAGTAPRRRVVRFVIKRPQTPAQAHTQRGALGD